MNNKIRRMLIFLLSLITIFLFSCSKNKEVVIKDDSKVLATVGEVKITQKQLETLMISSSFTKEQMMEKLINNQLLLIKAKELNITVSEEEVKIVLEEQKNLFEQADNKNEMKQFLNNYIKEQGLSEDDYWNIVAAKGYKDSMIIGKTRRQLGLDVDQALKELREKIKIEYY